MNTTVKSPVDVAATAVSRVLNNNTGTAETGNSPPSGVFTSIPQKFSAIVCNFCNNKKHTELFERRMRMACMFHQRERVHRWNKSRDSHGIYSSEAPRLVIIVGGRPRSRERVNAEQPSAVIFVICGVSTDQEDEPDHLDHLLVWAYPPILVTLHDSQNFSKTTRKLKLL